MLACVHNTVKPKKFRYMRNIILILTALLSLTANAHATAEANKSVADSTTTDSISREMSIDNITVVTSRIRQKANGFSLNLANSKLADTFSIDQMMSMLPYIQVNDGNVSIYGKEASAVYIDGVKITDKEQLKVLRPNMIERIEVEYFNTGSESASKPGGIMRIWLKHREKGYTVGIQGGTQARTKTGSDGFNLATYQMASFGRFTLFNALSYRRGLSEEKYKTNKMVNTTASESNERERANSNTWMEWMTISADIGHGQQVGISASASYYKGTATLDASNTESNDVTTNTYQSVMWAPSKNITLNGVAFYNWNIDDRGSNLNITADYLWYNSKRKNSFNTITGNGLITDYSQDADNYTRLLRIKPVWKNVQNNGNILSTGLDYNMNNVGEDERINKIRQNVMGHEAAAFASYDGTLGQLSYNANMRVQYNSMKVVTNGFTDKRDYWSLCPSAVLKYYLDKKQKYSIALTYNRNVYGIPYSGVSNYRVYDGANHYSMGNPDIDIPASQWINMEITLFKSLHLNFSYTKNEKSLFYEEETDPDNPNTTRSVLQNSKKDDTKQISLEWRKYITDNFYVKLGGYTSWSSFKTNSSEYKDQFSWYAYANFMTWLKNGMCINVYGYYDPSKYIWEIKMNDVWYAAVSVSKSFFKKKLQMKLTVAPYSKPRVLDVIKTDLSYRRETKNDGTFIKLELYYTLSGGNLRQRRQAQSIQQYEEQKNIY